MEQMYISFGIFAKKHLFGTMNNNIPNKEIKSRNNIPWVKRKERKMLKKKQRLYKQARKTNKWTNYRTFQKECKRHLRKAEWDYVRDRPFNLQRGYGFLFR
jgi:hypothetical protein